jgi:hypothetical protein
MRIIVLSLILFCCGTCPITAQSDYIVTTPSTQEIPVGEEEQFSEYVLWKTDYATTLALLTATES